LSRTERQHNHTDRPKKGTLKEVFFLQDYGTLTSWNLVNMGDDVFELEIHMYSGTEEAPGERTTYVFYGPRDLFQAAHRMFKDVVGG
jgi:hypothetical protein